MNETKSAHSPVRAVADRRLLARYRPLFLCVALGALLPAASCGGGTKQTTAPIDTTKPNADQYVNPVINADFPDPSVMRASDGNYYAYATQTNGVRLQVARSSDLVSWTKLGEALPGKPTWTATTSNYFAPDVEERGGTFVMYFSAQPPSTDEHYCIGMATATTAAGPFTDVGAPVVCGSGFTTIDPMGFDDPKTGTPYLYWGSNGQPIKVQQLAPDRKSFAAGSAPISLVSPSNGTYDSGLIEGAWVTYHDPYYYLYFSGNNCCGPNAHYAVMVARSSSPTGPFEKLTTAGSSAARPILQSGSVWTEPGHNSTITDGAGTEWMVYHAINVNNPYLNSGSTAVSRRPMLIDRVTYDANGWPVVGTNGTPTSTPQTRPK